MFFTCSASYLDIVGNHHLFKQIGTTSNSISNETTELNLQATGTKNETICKLQTHRQKGENLKQKELPHGLMAIGHCRDTSMAGAAGLGCCGATAGAFISPAAAKTAGIGCCCCCGCCWFLPCSITTPECPAILGHRCQNLKAGSAIRDPDRCAPAQKPNLAARAVGIGSRTFEQGRAPRLIQSLELKKQRETEEGGERSRSEGSDQEAKFGTGTRRLRGIGFGEEVRGGKAKSFGVLGSRRRWWWGRRS